jgi:agmatinase
VSHHAGSLVDRRVAHPEDSMQRYEANLPSVGLVSFLKSPICEDFSKIDADVAVLGIPYDAGIGFRPGTRFGPRDIRTYSVRYSGWGSWKTSGYWDINDGKRKLASTRIVDCGDVDVAYYDFERNSRLMRESVGAILDRKALPVLLGGDHSVTYPIVSAFERFGPLDIVHIDAHLDWIDHVDGIKFANGSPFRRISELPFVRHERTWESCIRSAQARQRRDQVRRADLHPAVDPRARHPGRSRPDAAMNNIYVRSTSTGCARRSQHRLADRRRPALSRGPRAAAGVAAKGRVVGFDVVEVNRCSTCGQTRCSPPP